MFKLIERFSPAPLIGPNQPSSHEISTGGRLQPQNYPSVSKPVAFDIRELIFTSSLPELFRLNFTHILRCTKDQLKHWNSLPLSPCRPHCNNQNVSSTWNQLLFLVSNQRPIGSMHLTTEEINHLDSNPQHYNKANSKQWSFNAPNVLHYYVAPSWNGFTQMFTKSHG